MKSFAVLSLLVAPLAFAADLQVSLIQTQVGRPLGDGVPFDVKPMGHEAGVKLSFLVRGENLVAFKDDSVDIKTFKLADGKELAKTRAGKPNWDQESFSKVSEDGKVGSFSVKFPGDGTGGVEGATLDGSIVVVTASKSEEKEVEITLADKAAKEAGPFKVAPGGGGGFFGGDGGGTGIEITGEYQGVIEILVEDGGKKLESNGSSSSGNKKTYFFAKTEAKTVKVKVRYWTDMKEQPLPFKLEPGKK
jgi:hypothetical protein